MQSLAAYTNCASHVLHDCTQAARKHHASVQACSSIQLLTCMQEHQPDQQMQFQLTKRASKTLCAALQWALGLVPLVDPDARFVSGNPPAEGQSQTQTLLLPSL